MTQITAAKTKRENAPFQLGSFLKTKTLLAWLIGLALQRKLKHLLNTATI